MFNTITYKNAIGPGPLIDVGALAEGLLFYERVAIIGNGATIKDIFNQIPPFIFLSLLQEGRIEFHYLADQTGVSAISQVDGHSIFDLIKFSSPDLAMEKVGFHAFIEAAGNTSQAKVGAKQFINHLRSLDHSEFDQLSVLQALADTNLTELCVKSLIQEIVPSYIAPNDIQFKVKREIQGFYVDTNIDFLQLNSHYKKTVPPEHSTLTESYILALIQGAYQTTYFAALLNSEIAVHPIERAVQSSIVNSIVQRYVNSQSQIEKFVELIVSNGHGIREAVNSGAVPFSSVCKILNSADKFRHWLRDQPTDASLIQAYYQEIIKRSWIEKLPGKTMRWIIFTGIGLGIDALGAGGIGTASATAISAADAFLIEKMITGWKPHQFIEKEFRYLFDIKNSKNG